MLLLFGCLMSRNTICDLITEQVEAYIERGNAYLIDDIVEALTFLRVEVQEFSIGEMRVLDGVEVCVCLSLCLFGNPSH